MTCPTCGAELRIVVQDGAAEEDESTYACPNGHEVQESESRQIQT